MVNKNYRAGRAAENYIKRRLKAKGGIIVRAAASKSPIDLVYFYHGQCWAIQVKTSRHGMSSARADAMWVETLGAIQEHWGTLVLVYKDNKTGRYSAIPEYTRLFEKAEAI